MNQILCYDRLAEWARWSYPAHSRLPTVSGKKKFPQKPNTKSFIDQVCSVKMAGYWPCSFFWVYRTCLSLIHKHPKEELGQYPAILSSHLVNNPYIRAKWPIRPDLILVSVAWSDHKYFHSPLDRMLVHRVTLKFTSIHLYNVSGLGLILDSLIHKPAH